MRCGALFAHGFFMQNQARYSLPLSFFALIGALPMLWYQFQIALNTNHAWLLIAAERFLDGGQYGSDFYEPNPPMSLLIYVPQFLMHDWLGIPLHLVPASFGLLFLLGAAAVFYYQLQRYALISDPGINMLILPSFIVAGTFMPGNIYFAERDHFVFLTLVPALYAQLAITNGATIRPNLGRAAFLLAGLLLLIKPHYGLFPALIFLHRLYKTRNMKSVIYAPDFQGLTISVFVYALVIAIIFPTYISEVLPDFFQIYLKDLSSNIFSYFLYYAFLCVCLAMGAVFFPLHEQAKKVTLCLTLAALVAFFLYFLQGKNFTYHTIAGLSFFFMGLSILLWGMVDRIILKGRGHPIAPAVFLSLMLMGAYIMRPPLPNFPTHEAYANTPLAEEIENCANPCPHFIFSENMEIIFQVSLYTNAPHASRYPGLWWLDYAIKYPEDTETRDKHLENMAEDFEQYRPQILLIATNMKRGGVENFDLMSFMRGDKNLAAVLNNYNYDHTLEDNRRYYFTGTNFDRDFPIAYDVYRLNNSQ